MIALDLTPSILSISFHAYLYSQKLQKILLLHYRQEELLYQSGILLMIFPSTLDHPVHHYLLGDMNIIPQEFLADPLQRNPVYTLGIHNTCHQRWHQDAVTEQSFQTDSLNECLIVRSNIASYMMLFDCVHSWPNTDSFVNLIWKPLPAIPLALVSSIVRE